VFKNRLLRKILGSKRDEITRRGVKCIMRSIMFPTPHKTLLFGQFDQIKENELEAACGTYGGEETCIQGLGREACRKEKCWKTKA